MNKIITIIATLAIVALSALTVYRTEKLANKLVELQQYHEYDSVVIDECPHIWESVDEVIEFRKSEMEWEKTVADWYNMPEQSLKHILRNHGIHLSIMQMVEIYNTNKDYYQAFEDGIKTIFEESAVDDADIQDTIEWTHVETPDTTQ